MRLAGLTPVVVVLVFGSAFARTAFAEGSSSFSIQLSGSSQNCAGAIDNAKSRYTTGVDPITDGMKSSREVESKAQAALLCTYLGKGEPVFPAVTDGLFKPNGMYVTNGQDARCSVDSAGKNYTAVKVFGACYDASVE